MHAKSVSPRTSVTAHDKSKPDRLHLGTNNHMSQVPESKVASSHKTAPDYHTWDKSPGTMLSPVTSTRSAANSDQKSVEALISAYNSVKICSVKVVKCCERLKTINQDGRIGLLQDFVSQFRLTRDNLKKFIDSTASISATLELRRNGVDMLKYEILMTTEFLLGNGVSPNMEEFRQLVIYR